MRTAKRDFVHTSSLAHIKELGEVPESRLSMFALAEDVSRNTVFWRQRTDRCTTDVAAKIYDERL